MGLMDGNGIQEDWWKGFSLAEELEGTKRMVLQDTFIFQCHHCPVLSVRLRIVIFTLVSSTGFIGIFIEDTQERGHAETPFGGVTW